MSNIVKASFEEDGLPCTRTQSSSGSPMWEPLAETFREGFQDALLYDQVMD